MVFRYSLVFKYSGRSLLLLKTNLLIFLLISIFKLLFNRIEKIDISVSIVPDDRFYKFMSI